VDAGCPPGSSAEQPNNLKARTSQECDLASSKKTAEEEE